jgi:hypothetical protein
MGRLVCHRVLVLALALTVVCTLAAVAIAAASPPGSGTYTIRSDADTAGGQPIDEFHGAFKVSGGRVSGLHGVSQHGVKTGCKRNETITMIGSQPILHLVIASTGSDFYWVGNAHTLAFANVRLTFKGPGRSAKVHRGAGSLRIYFPGGTDVSVGATINSDLSYDSKWAGFCDLKFSIS